MSGGWARHAREMVSGNATGCYISMVAIVLALALIQLAKARGQ